ncbi:MAG: hypothetical protein GY855_03360 [candidate division Zixibacteria bacterium]|nr:hypothetical protein [candidate division Zixibacteria bacterium]
MCKRFIGAVLLTLLVQVLIGPAMSQSEPPTDVPQRPVPQNEVISIRPDYIPPVELLAFLGVNLDGNRGDLEWQTESGWHHVDIHFNDVANLLILSGQADDLEYISDLIREADVPPRQIEIEVKIVQVSKSKALDAGIDWEGMLSKSRPRISYRYADNESNNHIIRTLPTESESKDHRDTESETWEYNQALYINDALKLLDSSGVATIRTAPRVLTLNNRRATILDGKRVTYITKYSAYSNLYETDSLDAGLTLSVLPSLGESGYITMQINAELTQLESSKSSNSPVKDGQMIDNTVIVKDGESILLGGLTQTYETRSHKRFPLLGHILPGLFSREVIIDEEMESIMILTPHIVDLETALDDRTIEIIDGE